jgi:hypothetical protein
MPSAKSYDADVQFWTLPLPEQVHRAMRLVRRQVRQADVEVLVGRLVNYVEATGSWGDTVANWIHGGRAFGQAEFLRRHKGQVRTIGTASPVAARPTMSA